MVRLTVFLVGGLCALLLNTCSGAVNPFTGVVQANVAGHPVVVTDCYRLILPPIERIVDTAPAGRAGSESNRPGDGATAGRSGATAPEAATPEAATPEADGSAALPGATESMTWRFAACSDAVIEIQGDQLRVNGVPYGAIAPGDAITVDHGAVYINGRVRPVV